MLDILIAAVIGYAAGCFNSAYYYAKTKRINIFEHGSASGGATNIARVFNKKAALLIFAADILKLYFALLITTKLLPALGLYSTHNYITGITILAVIIGHIFPVQLKFKGGKGVACLMGAGFYVLSLKAIISILLIFFIAYLILFLFTKKPYKPATYITLLSSPVVAALDLNRTLLIYIFISIFFIILAHINARVKKKKLIFKIASNSDEFEAIEKLNYSTFVEEIPQHNQNAKKSLKDKFHDKNTYIICKHGNEVAAMVALNALRPFSLDGKIENLDNYLPAGAAKLCEIRLLSIKPAYRKGKILQGLMKEIFKYIKKNSIEILLISGTTRETKMYAKLGFTPFYKLVGKEGALYQPMLLEVNKKISEAKKWKL
jgi:acyl-phosphate glycerol 3-phosphate acyltransferase